MGVVNDAFGHPQTVVVLGGTVVVVVLAGTVVDVVVDPAAA